MQKRKELRLPEYDYSQNGYYFVTICTKDRRNILWDMTTGVVKDGAAIQSKRVKKAGTALWQKSFYDHVIRSEADYIIVWQYIEDNPLKWELDKYYSD